MGAHTPVGTRKAHGAGDGPDADHGPGHGARDPDAQRHPVPYASDDTRGAPNGGAFEREQPLLQGQPPPTPYAPGDDIRANVAIGGRALDTRKPPALAGTHKHRARRGSASPPLRTAEDEADAEGRVPSDTAGQYVDFDGASHGPEGRADHTELARARAEVERLRKALEMYRDRERVQAHGARFYDPNREAKMPNETETEAETKTKTTTTSAAAARRARRPGDAENPDPNPGHQLPSGRVDRPARPSSKRLRARPRASPVGRPGRRFTQRLWRNCARGSTGGSK